MRFVTKRDGTKEEISFDKIIHRIEKLLCKQPVLKNVSAVDIAQSVVAKIVENISTVRLDVLSAETAYGRSDHPEYPILAGRIAVSNLQKNTPRSFTAAVQGYYNRYDAYNKHSPIVAERVRVFTEKFGAELDAAIDYERDYLLSYMSVRVLETTYLLRSCSGEVIEGPQHMFMRIAVGLNSQECTTEALAAAIESYNMFSTLLYTHATPTLYSCGTTSECLISCFLFEVPDSIAGMYKALSSCALIAQATGGIGLHVHSIREEGAMIRSTGRPSTGMMPWLKVLGQTTQHVDQGRKRPASVALFLEMWHPFTVDMIMLRKNIAVSRANQFQAEEDKKIRTLFPALWMPRLFFKRARAKQTWSFFSPLVAGHLSELYGDAFEREYLRLESDPANIHHQMNASDILIIIASSMIETGVPYLLNKDEVNEKSNYQHYGTIKSSNLCTEIVEYSSPKETACCTLASVAPKHHLVPFDVSSIRTVTILSKENCNYCEYSKRLLTHLGIPFTEVDCTETGFRARMFASFQRNFNCLDDCARCERIGSIGNSYGSFPQIFINDEHIGGFDDLFKYIRPKLDYAKLMRTVKMAVKNLDRLIDINKYPTPEAELSNHLHRPLGIGIQGLADTFAALRLPYDGKEAFEVNRAISCAMYYAACEASMELAKQKGPYKTFAGSPMSKGQFQFDLWKTTPLSALTPKEHYALETISFDWEKLRADITTYGLRNAQLIALMPTATTSIILGQNDSFEAFSNIIYKKNIYNIGDILAYNYAFMSDMMSINMWTPSLFREIIQNNSGVQGLSSIPPVIQGIYKTSWDISMKVMIDMAADRGAYTCQSESGNRFMRDATVSKVCSLILYAADKGIKTISYYLRVQGSVQMQKMMIAPDAAVENKDEAEDEVEERRVDNVGDELANMVVVGPPDCESCSA
jgi:ribonucleoside-diphosphate reductase alpha subunit